jgi:hypothetical protein
MMLSNSAAIGTSDGPRVSFARQLVLRKSVFRQLVSASGCHYTRALRYKVPGRWQESDCLSLEPTGARLRCENARRE